MVCVVIKRWAQSWTSNQETGLKLGPLSTDVGGLTPVAVALSNMPEVGWRGLSKPCAT